MFLFICNVFYISCVRVQYIHNTTRSMQMIVHYSNILHEMYSYMVACFIQQRTRTQIHAHSHMHTCTKNQRAERTQRSHKITGFYSYRRLLFIHYNILVYIVHSCKPTIYKVSHCSFERQFIQASLDEMLQRLQHILCSCVLVECARYYCCCFCSLLA